MLVLSIGLLVIIYYSKKNSETDCEKEIRQLRQLQLSGKLDKKRFLQFKNRLMVDISSFEQREILEKMLKKERIDSVTFRRMQKALQFSLNQKLRKSNKIVY